MPTNYAYVAHGQVAVINPVGPTLVTEIDFAPSTDGASQLGITPDGSLLWVRSSASGTPLFAIETATNTIVAGPISPTAQFADYSWLAVTQDNCYVVGANSGNASYVDVYSNSTYALVDQIHLNGGTTLEPSFGESIITLISDGAYLYTYYNDSNPAMQVAVIDPTSNTIVDTVAFAGTDHNIGWAALAPGTSKVYLYDARSSGNALVYSCAEGTATPTTTIDMGANSVQADLLYASTDGDYVYAPVSSSSVVNVIDTSTDTIVNAQAVSGTPLMVAQPDPNTTYNYVTDLNADYLSIFQGSVLASTVSSATLTGRFACVSPDGTALFDGGGNGYVNVYDTAANTFVGTVSLAAVAPVEWIVAANPSPASPLQIVMLT